MIPPIRLLDVGSCGTLFDGYAHIDATAVDLCPQAANRRVYQCDFLTLPLGARGSAPDVRPSERFPGGTLHSLAAEGYDAVALSLVLSYVPTPAQRGAMIRKARQLLPPPESPSGLVPPPADTTLSGGGGGGAGIGGAEGGGSGGGGGGGSCGWRRGLLLVVDTFSVDSSKASRSSGEFLRCWIESIEREGFVFLRHHVLTRSHALAFATAPLPLPAEGQAEGQAEERAMPELRMRREERGEWQ